MQTVIYVVREFKFKGYLPEQLQALPIESLLPLLNSRQRRSLDKRVGKFMTDEKRKLREEIKRNREGKSTNEIKTHLRDMIILPDMIGVIIKVHNGKEFVPVSIRPEMVGHYVGEYSITNKRVQHGAPGVGSSRSSLYVPLK
jgi:small subunit ribosomal protein S19